VRITTLIFSLLGIITFAQIAKGAPPTEIKDKTLVLWAAPANLNQRGGSALTLDDLASHFDGIIFGEIAKGKWMAGSDFYQRSQRDQKTCPPETADQNTFVQIAIVYKGYNITIYRQGREYSSYKITRPQTFGSDSVVMFGKRHVDTTDTSCFRGKIDDARIYDKALTARQIAALKPNKPSDIQPLAWWTFEDGRPADSMGNFPETYLTGGAKITGGNLVLEGRQPIMIAAPKAFFSLMLAKSAPRTEDKNLVAAQRLLRQKLLSDPHRPVYHFVTPEGRCMPFDGIISVTSFRTNAATVGAMSQAGTFYTGDGTAPHYSLHPATSTVESSAATALSTKRAKLQSFTMVSVPATVSLRAADRS